MFAEIQVGNKIWEDFRVGVATVTLEVKSFHLSTHPIWTPDNGDC